MIGADTAQGAFYYVGAFAACYGVAWASGVFIEGFNKAVGAVNLTNEEQIMISNVMAWGWGALTIHPAFKQK